MKRCFKFVLIASLVVVIALCIPFSSSSHSGKTDGNGGHYNSSTGEYHYHHGYPAHQHTNGVCPYNYKENSATSSNSSSQGTPWYVYAVIVAVVIAWFLLDLKFDGKVTMFFVFGAFYILLSPFFIIGWIFSFVGWIIKKFK